MMISVMLGAGGCSCWSVRLLLRTTHCRPAAGFTFLLTDACWLLAGCCWWLVELTWMPAVRKPHSGVLWWRRRQGWGCGAACAVIGSWQMVWLFSLDQPPPQPLCLLVSMLFLHAPVGCSVSVWCLENNVFRYPKSNP